MMQNRKKNYAYYIANRVFDNPELRTLIDAVQSAAFIPEDITDRFIGKIAGLAGNDRAELMRNGCVCFDAVKHIDKHVSCSVDILAGAIKQKKKVSFLYYDFDLNKNKVYRKSGNRYVVNPLALVYTGDAHYLICCFDCSDEFCNYRLDRMENAEIMESDIKPGHENFDFDAYKQQVFSMFTNE